MMSQIFTISRLTICRNSVVKYKYQPSKSLENALFSAFYLSSVFIVGITTHPVSYLVNNVIRRIHIIGKHFINGHFAFRCQFFRTTNIFLCHMNHLSNQSHRHILLQNVAILHSTSST